LFEDSFRIAAFLNHKPPAHRLAERLGKTFLTAQNLADLGHFVPEVRPPSQDPLFDEIQKTREKWRNTGEMERSGNFSLSCDIKEACTMWRMPKMDSAN